MIFIGICGASGSGKSTLADSLAAALGERCFVLQQDCYYKDHSHLPFEERCQLNYDEPGIFDHDALLADVQALMNGLISSLGIKPALVITDSQVFGKISKECPDDIPLTSFSILLARFKGYLETAVKGVKAIEELKDNDTILISEGCTHHRQCNDIGTVKLPKLLTSYTDKKLNFEFTSGTEFPDNLDKYSLVIHCGGCMLNEREVMYRMNHSVSCNTPFTNYGTAIAYMNGILKKSLIMPEFKDIL